MYVPTAFREEDLEKLVAFMQANSFATLVSVQNNLPVASHIPIVITVENNQVKLSGHLAKQNPQWKVFGEKESLAIFTGAHAYISPSLYEKPEEVPTWNYIAVHAWGIPQIITRQDAPDRMEQMISGMIDTYESDFQARWDEMSDGYREGMMQGIVGFEMPIDRLEGKYKLSQNRSTADQSNVAHSLLQSADPTVQAVGVEMKQNLDRQ